MVRITTLDIEGFRGFKRLHVGGLSRVNLVVGANNSGKSALLEAIEAVASEQSPFVLHRAALERGEWRPGRTRGHDDDVVHLDVRHWFHGHELAAGSRFSIRAEGTHELEVSRAVERVPPEAPSPPFVPGGLMITLRQNRMTVPVPPLPLLPDGFLGASPASVVAEHDARLRPPVAFLTTRRLGPDELVPLWNNLVLTPSEESTVRALRLVEPRIERIAISGGSGPAIAQILLQGSARPVPLGTLGEGVSRLLALALKLATARGGVLLVDEIESGLHWTVMPKLWRFLVETARELDVQVFATTHSKDCIEGVAELHEEHPSLASEVGVHRLEVGRETTVRLDAGRVAEHVAMDLETR